MLGDGVLHYLAVLRNTVKLYLVGLGHEFGNNHGVFLADLAGCGQEALQFLVVVAYVHGSTGKDVGRTNQYGITDLVDELLHIGHAGKCAPTGLVNTKLVEHGTELATVLGTVDADGIGTQYGNCLTEEFHGQVVGNLSAHADNHTAGTFQVDDIEDAFETQLVEIEAVAHVIVGGNGLGVVVYHDALVTELACCLYGIDGAPVELYAGTDAVSARTKYDYTL